MRGCIFSRLHHHVKECYSVPGRQQQLLLPAFHQYSRNLSSTTDNVEKTTAPRRRRHNFSKLDNIPSLADFTRKVQVKSLYRQYLRLVFPLKSSSPDLLVQVRSEFRLFKTNNIDAWQQKRALSEGHRRLKELSSMLGSVVDTRTRKNTNKSSSSGASEDAVEDKKEAGLAWPWENSDAMPSKPLNPPKR